MLNLAVGDQQNYKGDECIFTSKELVGHAVYGPYEFYNAGDYAVEFVVYSADLHGIADDGVCAIADVAADDGSLTIAALQVHASDLRGGLTYIQLPFQLAERKKLEFRLYTTGLARMLISGRRNVAQLPSAEANYATLLEERRFPDTETLPKSHFFFDVQGLLKAYYDAGVIVQTSSSEVFLTFGDVRIRADQRDDIRFVNEIFLENTYNFRCTRNLCVIDVGMNVGLASLFFASKSNVKEVHSFEPFKSTYDRAIKNFEVNPQLGSKIRPHNFGLSGENNAEMSVFLTDLDDSGRQSIFGSSSGERTTFAVRDASEIFRPIIEHARTNGLAVVAKIDCEGAEFPIFESLAKAGLIDGIFALLVEWHRGFEGKDQNDLIAPLEASGFMVFDVSKREGNGFFYAVNGRYQS